MVSFIDTSKLHPNCAHRIYKYAAMVDVNEVAAGNNPPVKHQILCKLRGPKHKWQLVGNSEDGAYEYPTEKDARNDVKKINQWIKSLESNGKPE